MSAQPLPQETDAYPPTKAKKKTSWKRRRIDQTLPQEGDIAAMQNLQPRVLRSGACQKAMIACLRAEKRSEVELFHENLPPSLRRLWGDALLHLYSGADGFSKSALRSAGVASEKAALEQSPLSRFSVRCNGAPREIPRVVLRVRARRMRWSHRGVRIFLKQASLEIGGVPVATIKLTTGKPHKRGKKFVGKRRFRVEFDHHAVRPTDPPRSL